MVYGITLKFDEATALKIQRHIVLAHQGGGNSFMLEHSLPPHLTISMFSCPAGDHVVVENLEKRLPLFSAGNVRWPSLGAFVPSVLFIAPVLGGFLQHVCETANDAARSLEGAVLEKNYTPSNWVPHTSIAVKLAGSELESAFSAVSRSFEPLEGTAESLSLIDCEAFKEIKSWRLG
jgi:hypothetical protein